MQAKKPNGPLARAACRESANKLDHVEISNSRSESQRISPASIASERAILGAIIEDDDLIMPDVIGSGLCPEDFFLSDHRRIFAAMLELWQKKRHIDLILVHEWLGNRSEDAAVIASLIQGVIVHTDHVLNHVEIVRNKARLRECLRISEWVCNVVDDSADADLIIEEAIQRFERAARPEVKA